MEQKSAGRHFEKNVRFCWGVDSNAWHGIEPSWNPREKHSFSLVQVNVSDDFCSILWLSLIIQGSSKVINYQRDLLHKHNTTYSRLFKSREKLEKLRRGRNTLLLQLTVEHDLQTVSDIFRSFSVLLSANRQSVHVDAVFEMAAWLWLKLSDEVASDSKMPFCEFCLIVVFCGAGMLFFRLNILRARGTVSPT